MRGTPVVLVRVALDDPAEDLVPGLSAVVGIRKDAPVLDPPPFAQRSSPATTVAETR